MWKKRGKQPGHNSETIFVANHEIKYDHKTRRRKHQEPDQDRRDDRSQRLTQYILVYTLDDRSVLRRRRKFSYKIIQEQACACHRLCRRGGGG